MDFVLDSKEIDWIKMALCCSPLKWCLVLRHHLPHQYTWKHINFNFLQIISTTFWINSVWNITLVTVLSAHCLSAYQQLHSLQILKKKIKKNYLKANVLQYVATQSNQTCPVCTSINIRSHKFMMYPCICTSHTTWYHTSIATLSSLSEAILCLANVCVLFLFYDNSKQHNFQN